MVEIIIEKKPHPKVKGLKKKRCPLIFRIEETEYPYDKARLFIYGDNLKFYSRKIKEEI